MDHWLRIRNPSELHPAITHAISSMTPEATKPRRLPRFSLITLLVAVNVAGVLVWANVRQRQPWYMFNTSQRLWYVQGWPFEARLSTDEPDGADQVRWNRSWQWWSVVGNAMFAIFVIGGSCTLIEYLVRKGNRG